ncbi:MAG: HDOD domain-containing protein [Gammaproteobacteria bacterium]|nr:HDOD domain-containing protein [Gammaproteobacteria bacterium]
MITPQTLVNDSIKLVSLPDIYVSLNNVLKNPDYSMSDVAMVIGHDPALTSRLLKIVNSPFYGLVSHVDSITHAINLLGTRQIHDLALATSIVNSFSGFHNDIISMYDYWFNSVYCAVSCQLLAYHYKDIDTERPFVAGLLHDIGHLVMYQEIPDESRPTISLAKEKGIELYLAERELLGFDYAQVGAELMRVWALPESLYRVTEFQNEPDKVDQFSLETAIVHMAALLARAAITKQEVTESSLPIHPVCWEITGLTPDILSIIKQEADQQVVMAMDLLVAKTKHA